ncbi:MAG TPA: ABC transporter permease [Anaerolineales bacterium]|nr:ABC transporter permease [Anaerolineales bacterium]HMX18876.1 ABC transporter permease [Anaerolineales bacterium]HMX75757.1 ABC transporter permease [Anaerolineales bacterium]HMZ43488.1 ABC transporter permease [Anaerolineales bacterium]HNA53482.1 ABC transporter permease [Anaerolineales bacterium]
MSDISLPREQSMGRIVLRRFFKHKLAGIAIGILLILILVAVFAGLNSHNPLEQNPTNSFATPNATNWFGTDELGRDVLSRIMYGGRVSLAVGLLSTLLSILLGITVGALSGYFGGWLDSTLMRVTDAFLTFPTIFVLIILGAFLREQQLFILQNSIFVVIIIIAALSWMWPARLVRGLFLVLREKEFVTASRALGGSDFRIIVQHILPNCMGPILVSGTLQMASAIITESGLSYLGFGVQPPTPTWGSILSTAQNQIFRAPWLGFFPGFMIFITVMAINYIGDGLRDAFDPYVIHSEK